MRIPRLRGKSTTHRENASAAACMLTGRGHIGELNSKGEMLHFSVNTYDFKVHCISRGEIPLLQYFLVDELALLSFKVKGESQTQVQTASISLNPCLYLCLYPVPVPVHACLHVVDQRCWSRLTPSSLTVHTIRVVIWRVLTIHW